MPNPNDPAEWECHRCHDTGYRPHSNVLCECVAGTLRVLAAQPARPNDQP
jgi:hypothetical protein